MTTASEILGLLAEGPATTGEIAALTGETSNRACAWLNHLLRAGRVSRQRHVRSAGPGRRNTWLWSIV